MVYIAGERKHGASTGLARQCRWRWSDTLPDRPRTTRRQGNGRRGPSESEGQWVEIMESERLAGALLDRLTHRVHIIEANGPSYRLRETKRRQSRQKVKTGNDTQVRGG